MTKQNHVTRGGRYGVAALLLIGTSAAALAQAADDTMVTADTATHTATLTGTGEGTAWFLIDPQNNTIRWTIEYTGVEATGASINCPGPADAAAAPAGDAADTPATGGLTGQIVLVDAAGADAGAGMAPAAPAAGADAGMAPAAPAGGADAGAGMAPAAPADAGAAAGGDAPAMSGDMAGMVEVLNLLEEGGTMTSPLDGETADLDETVFANISSGACFLEITVAGTGGADAAAPATPAVPPAP